MRAAGRDDRRHPRRCSREWWGKDGPSYDWLWIGLAVVGGSLQYAYVEAKHPSLLLKVWGVLATLLVIVALADITIRIATAFGAAIRRRRR